MKQWVKSCLSIYDNAKTSYGRFRDTMYLIYPSVNNNFEKQSELFSTEIVNAFIMLKRLR